MDLPPDTGEKPLKSFVMLDLSSLAERTRWFCAPTYLTVQCTTLLPSVSILAQFHRGAE